jgi:hypothetical protein
MQRMGRKRKYWNDGRIRPTNPGVPAAMWLLDKSEFEGGVVLFYVASCSFQQPWAGRAPALRLPTHVTREAKQSSDTRPGPRPRPVTDGASSNIVCTTGGP